MPQVMPVMHDRPDAAVLSTLALSWIERETRARMLVQRGSVLWMNAAAHGVLANDPALSVQGGALAFIGQSGAAAYAARAERPDPDGTTLAIPFVRSAGHFLIRLWPIGDPADGIRGVEISVDHAGFEARYADFGGAFALTGAERETAQGMIDGLAPREIALRRKVSIDTVRSHIRAIYLKSGVSTREQFFRRLAAFRIV